MDHMKSVTDYLESKGVEYTMGRHEAAYTAMETAEAQHVPGREMVKTVIVEGPEGLMLIVLPAIHNVDFEKLRGVVGVEDLKLASEEQVGKLFPQCDLGAEPPFGYWAGLPVYMDRSLQDEEWMVFNAGTHTETIRMSVDDFRRIENPMVVDIGVHVSVGQLRP